MYLFCLWAGPSVAYSCDTSVTQWDLGVRVRVTRALALAISRAALEEKRRRRDAVSACWLMVFQAFQLLSNPDYATSPCSNAQPCAVFSFSRPKLLSPPSSICLCALIECVSVSPCLLRIAEISLLHRVRNNDYEAKVLARNRVVQIVRLGTKRKVLVIIRFGYRLAWRRVLERSCNENQ